MRLAVIRGQWRRVIAAQITGGPSSSCEMIILRNNGHGGIIRVCMGISTTALRNKKYTSNSQKKNLTSLPQRIACYLTAYFDEKSPFERVVHFEVFNVHKKSPNCFRTTGPLRSKSIERLLFYPKVKEISIYKGTWQETHSQSAKFSVTGN